MSKENKTSKLDLLAGIIPEQKEHCVFEAIFSGL